MIEGFLFGIGLWFAYMLFKTGSYITIIIVLILLAIFIKKN